LLASTLAVIAMLTYILYLGGYRDVALILVVIPGTFIAFILLAIVGLPIHSVLSKKGKTSLFHYALIGTLVGAIFLFTFAVLENPGSFSMPDAFSIFLFSVLGLIASIVFWVIAVRPVAVK